MNFLFFLMKNLALIELKLMLKKEIYDLSRHAAYNLISIYKHSGSYQLARNVMEKYLTI